MKAHIEMAGTLADNPDAKAAIDELIAAEARELSKQETARFSRKLNSSNTILAVVLTVISVAAIYLLAIWWLAVWGEPIAWLAGCLTIVVGLFLILLTASGYTTLYNPSRSKEERAAAKSAKGA